MQDTDAGLQDGVRKALHELRLLENTLEKVNAEDKATWLQPNPTAPSHTVSDDDKSAPEDEDASKETTAGMECIPELEEIAEDPRNTEGEGGEVAEGGVGAKSTPIVMRRRTQFPVFEMGVGVDRVSSIDRSRTVSQRDMSLSPGTPITVPGSPPAEF